MKMGNSNEQVRSKVDPEISDEELAEKYLLTCRHHLHPANHECWLGEKFTHPKHKEHMEAMGLKELKPADVIYPIEHSYYNYLNTAEILLGHVIYGFDDHVRRYKTQYEKHTGNGGEK